MEHAMLLVFENADFLLPPTIFDKLEEAGIPLSSDVRRKLLNSYRIMYDIECYLPRTNQLPTQRG